MYRVELIAKITGTHGTDEEVRAGQPVEGLDERMINLLLRQERVTVRLLPDEVKAAPKPVRRRTRKRAKVA